MLLEMTLGSGKERLHEVTLERFQGPEESAGARRRTVIPEKRDSLCRGMGGEATD